MWNATLNIDANKTLYEVFEVTGNKIKEKLDNVDSC